MQCATVAELSGRWNAGLMRYQRDTARPPQLSKIADADFRTTRILPERSLLVPVAFPAGWLSSALFTSGPFCDATIQPWTPPMLAQFCPATETPGLDGWTPAAVRSLDAVSAKCLCALLDDCGIGLFPSFFAQARLVGLPKPGSLERRPLTVLSVLYRVWASRMAAFAGTWMSARMPPEVYGARKGSSACDAGWRYTLLVDHARCSGVPLHCLAMDQKQRVDRLDLSQLEKLATAVGMPTMCIGALALYARLERHLFFWTDSPLDVISGSLLRGIPQGCPLSVHWCNLACWLLHVRLGLDCPGLDAVSFMDDRLLSSGDVLDLDAGLLCTAGVDAIFGSELGHHLVLDRSPRPAPGCFYSCGGHQVLGYRCHLAWLAVPHATSRERLPAVRSCTAMKAYPLPTGDTARCPGG